MTADTISRAQLREVLAHARAAKDVRLAACAMRAIDGDSLYDRALRERCASVYVGVIDAARAIRMTVNERRALTEFQKAEEDVDWSRVHGRTLHSLQRKKLIMSGKPGWRLTALGVETLRIPDVFDGMFETSPAKKSCRGRTRAHHADVTCGGECCTTCGGPVDENEECRC